MSRMVAIACLSLLLALACDEDPKLVEAEPEGSTETGATGGVDFEPTAVQGTSARAPAEPVTRNAACDPAYTMSTEGASLPWSGFEYQGTTYTCNKCPVGHPLWEGRWRLLDGPSEDPDVPINGGTRRDVMEFSGNTWRWIVEDDQNAEYKGTALVEAWFFCGLNPELGSEKMVFEILSSNSGGQVEGYTKGDVFTQGPLLFSGADKVLVPVDNGFGTDWIADFLYCRVGAEIETLDGDKKLCTDPFE